MIRRISAVFISLILNIDTAMADSVNGSWCGPEGRQFEISYETVKFPDGTEVNGDYDHHHYLFKMPPLLQWEGAEVDVVLGPQDIAYVRYISDIGLELLSEPEIWTRCKLDVG